MEMPHSLGLLEVFCCEQQPPTDSHLCPGAHIRSHPRSHIHSRTLSHMITSPLRDILTRTLTQACTGFRIFTVTPPIDTQRVQSHRLTHAHSHTCHTTHIHSYYTAVQKRTVHTQESHTQLTPPTTHTYGSTNAQARLETSQRIYFHNMT